VVMWDRVLEWSGARTYLVAATKVSNEVRAGYEHLVAFMWSLIVRGPHLVAGDEAAPVPHVTTDYGEFQWRRAITPLSHNISTRPLHNPHYYRPTPLCRPLAIDVATTSL